MFVAGEIKQKLLHKFSEVFFDPPFIMEYLNTDIYNHYKNRKQNIN